MHLNCSIFCVVLFVVIGMCNSFRLSYRSNFISRQTTLCTSSQRENNVPSEPIIIEISTKRSRSSNMETSEQSIVAYESVYKENKEDRVSVVLDSPIMKIFGVIFNPLALIITLYITILSSGKIGDFFSRVGSIFGGKGKNNQSTAPIEKVEELPYQVFECEVCQMQMRPAKGRASKIFGRERFRCSRCGSKASSYFNIDDKNDPRAVSRLLRLATEAEEEDEDEPNTNPNEDE